MIQDLEIITLKEKNKWRSLVESSLYRDIYQLPEYLEPFEKHMNAKALLARFVDEDCEIMYPFFLRNIKDYRKSKGGHYFKDIITPWYYGGPIFKGKINNAILGLFKEALMKYCKDNSIVTLFSRFNPFLGNHRNTIGDLNIRRINSIIWIDLTPKVNHIWSHSISKECRRKLRVSQKRDIEVKINRNKKDLRIFHDLYTKSMERKEASRFYFFSYEFLEKLYENLADNLIITLTEFENEVVYSSIYLFKYNIMYGLLGARNYNFPSVNSSSPEIWETVKWAKDKGIRIMDLGGGMENSPGLFQYKKSFSNNILPLYGQNSIMDFDLYKKICITKGHDRQNLSYENSKYFPEYRYSNIGNLI